MLGLLLALAIPAYANTVVVVAPAPVSGTAGILIPMHPGDVAPDHGLFISNDRAKYILELAVIGKAAQEGAFAEPAWKTWVSAAVTIITAAFVTYKELHTK